MICLVGLLCCASACSMENEEMARATSPDHKATAVLVREFGGGAAGSSNYYLYFASTEGKEELKRPNLTASECDSISIGWASDLVLQLHYSRCVIRQFENYWTSAYALRHIGAPSVEVVLVRDGDNNLAH